MTMLDLASPIQIGNNRWGARPQQSIPPRVLAILSEVQRERGVKGDMLGRDGPQPLRLARMEAWCRIRQEIVIGGRPPSYPQIGRWVGRDHTTVISACRKMAA